MRDSFGSATVLKSAKVTSRNFRMREPNRVVQPSSKLSVALECTLSLASACHSAARYNSCMRRVLYGSSRSPSNTGIAHCIFIGHWSVAPGKGSPYLQQVLIVMGGEFLHLRDIISKPPYCIQPKGWNLSKPISGEPHLGKGETSVPFIEGVNKRARRSRSRIQDSHHMPSATRGKSRN